VDEERARARVLMFLSTSRDAELAAEVLGSHGIVTACCHSDSELVARLEEGAGAILLAEEMLGAGDGALLLREVLRRQPRWSDLPVLLLTRSGADSDAVLEAVSSLGNVTLMERPMRVAALVSTVNAALRARARQYQIEQHLQELERAHAAEADNARRKDQFLAMLAHELRNPLAPIGNALKVLELDDSDPERRRQLREMMQRQLEHLVRLVDDLLEASRLSQGKIQLARIPHDLRDVLRESVEQAQLDQDHRKIDIVVRMPDAPMPVSVDPVRMGQVFSNLLNNARKYSSARGIVEVSARVDGDAALVRFKDNGIGMPRDLVPHVFDLFTQGNREEHRLHDGLGIGLALVRGLVEMHGGRVDADSAGPGAGSEFSVWLPLGSPTAGAADDAPSPEMPGERLRILVVDDNEDAAESLGLLLRAMGHEVCIAHDGAAALEQVDALMPDVALLDIGMPGMDGYELAGRLRANAALPHLVIAAVTGWGEAQDRKRAEAVGFDHVFRKPIASGDLARVLAGVEGARARGSQPQGSRRTMLASRSGPVLTIASGLPASSSSARR
jgi:signal transduction histidine kinase/ActR/RegA family two-component response regulator